jgi:DNA-binding PadR family transcriptional regulator
LEEKQYLGVKEEIIDGRANKFYMLTELGRTFLEELKLKWANLFNAMSEFNPSEGLEMLLINRIEGLNSKEDAIDFFRGIRSWNKNMLQHIEERIEKLKSSKVDLDNIISEIEEMDDFNKQQIKEAVAKLIKKETIKMNNSLK